jgi:hypothetical protein
VKRTADTGQVLRCRWCGRLSGDMSSLDPSSEAGEMRSLAADSIPVCDEHRLQLAAHFQRVARFGPYFLAFCVLCALLIMVGGAKGWDALMTWASLLLALSLIVFPVCTPETVQRIGVVRSILIARVAGIIIAVVAIAVLAVSTSR